MRVLNDGTILNNNGLTVGRITIDSDKYKDEIINAIESKFPIDIIDSIIEDYFPDTDSSDYNKIDEALKGLSLETIKDNYTEIVSVINYYR